MGHPAESSVCCCVVGVCDQHHSIVGYPCVFLVEARRNVSSCQLIRVSLLRCNHSASSIVEDNPCMCSGVIGWLSRQLDSGVTSIVTHWWIVDSRSSDWQTLRDTTNSLSTNLLVCCCGHLTGRSFNCMVVKLLMNLVLSCYFGACMNVSLLLFVIDVCHFDGLTETTTDSGISSIVLEGCCRSLSCALRDLSLCIVSMCVIFSIWDECMISLFSLFETSVWFLWF